MKKWILLAIVIAAPLIVGFSLAIVATGTPIKGTAFTMSFSRAIRDTLIINNRTGQVVYFKINDNLTTPTCSASSYDLCLDNQEMQIITRPSLERFPVGNISVYCNDTTATSIRITGW